MKRFRSMAYPYVFWIAIFIVIPMLLIIAYAFTVEGTAFFQGQFTLDNFARFSATPYSCRCFSAPCALRF